MRLKHLRKERGIKQIELCKILGISQGNLSNWENEVYEPDKNSLLKMAEYFGVSVDYLLGRTDEPNPNNQLTNTQPNLLPELLVQLDSLSLEQQEKVVAFIKGLLA